MVQSASSSTSASPQSFNIFLQSFPGASRDAVIYHKMSVYVNFIAHKIKAEKGKLPERRKGGKGTHFACNKVPEQSEGVACHIKMHLTSKNRTHQQQEQQQRPGEWSWVCRIRSRSCSQDAPWLLLLIFTLLPRCPSLLYSFRLGKRKMCNNFNYCNKCLCCSSAVSLMPLSFRLCRFWLGNLL